MKEETATKFIAFDGKEFLNRTECLEYEKYEKTAMYFKVLSHPDLTETGCFMRLTLLKIYQIDYINPKNVALDWCITKFGNIIGCSVMGHGHQEHWSMGIIDYNNFLNPTPIVWGGTPLKYDKIVISDLSYRKSIKN